MNKPPIKCCSFSACNDVVADSYIRESCMYMVKGLDSGAMSAMWTLFLGGR